ncbi:MAG TPA: hypothetical protein V6D48_10920 [Oculatellaceae cyanobacterium]
MAQACGFSGRSHMIAIIILDLSGRCESETGLSRSRCTLMTALGEDAGGFFLEAIVSTLLGKTPSIREAFA